MWFDWPKIDPAIPEDRESIDPVCQWLCSFIDGLIAEGTPSHRIILGTDVFIFLTYYKIDIIYNFIS